MPALRSEKGHFQPPLRGKEKLTPGNEVILLLIFELHCLLWVMAANPAVTSNDK